MMNQMAGSWICIDWLRRELGRFAVFQALISEILDVFTEGVTMPQLHTRNQPRPDAWAVYTPAKAIIEQIEAQTFAPWASEPGPTDDDICAMADWYAACQFGAFAVESDSYDKEIFHA